MNRTISTSHAISVGIAAFISTFVASAQQPANILPAGSLIVVGTGPGAGLVRVFHADGTEIGTTAPFGAGFTGGVRVAASDVKGDGVTDAIVGMASGGNHVRVYSGAELERGGTKAAHRLICRRASSEIGEHATYSLSNGSQRGSSKFKAKKFYSVAVLRALSANCSTRRFEL